MEIITCPACGNGVALTSDGRCPSCRAEVGGTAEARAGESAREEAIVAAVIADEDRPSPAADFDNPYRSPALEPPPQVVHGVRSGRREDLKGIAVSQKVIIVALLFYLLASIGPFIVPVVRDQVMITAVSFTCLAMYAVSGIVALVFVIMMAVKVYHPAVGVLLGLMVLVPCVGLILLVVVNGRATTILRANGVRVGFFGVSMEDIGRLQ